MTPAEQALANTITFEAKKDSLRQSQSGDWKIAFTVQGVDMDTRLSKAAPGTRYVAVLVEINDQELPVSQAEKEAMPNSRPVSRQDNAQPQPAPTAGAKRDWRDLQPQQQAGIRCGEPIFVAYLKEVYPHEWRETGDAAECVRLICGVHSRVELGTNNKARVIWHQLDEQFTTWKFLEHA